MRSCVLLFVSLLTAVAVGDVVHIDVVVKDQEGRPIKDASVQLSTASKIVIPYSQPKRKKYAFRLMSMVVRHKVSSVGTDMLIVMFQQMGITLRKSTMSTIMLITTTHRENIFLKIKVGACQSC